MTKDLPPYAIAAGVPATVRRLRFAEATIEGLLKLKWCDLELSGLSGLPFRNVERCSELIEEVKEKREHV